jgi:hypothetical protein
VAGALSHPKFAFFDSPKTQILPNLPNLQNLAKFCKFDPLKYPNPRLTIRQVPNHEKSHFSEKSQIWPNLRFLGKTAI